MKKNDYVGRLIEQFIEARPENRIRDRRKNFISFYQEFGHMRVNDVNGDILLKWFRREQKNNNYRERNLNRIKSPFNVFFEHLVDEEIIDKNPLKKVKFKKNKDAPRKERIILSQEEIHSIIRDLNLL